KRSEDPSEDEFGLAELVERGALRMPDRKRALEIDPRPSGVAEFEAHETAAGQRVAEQEIVVAERAGPAFDRVVVALERLGVATLANEELAKVVVRVTDRRVLVAHGLGREAQGL